MICCLIIVFRDYLCVQKKQKRQTRRRTKKSARMVLFAPQHTEAVGHCRQAAQHSGE